MQLSGIHPLRRRLGATLVAIALAISVLAVGKAQAKPKPPTGGGTTCELAGKSYNPGEEIEVTIQGKHGTEKRKYICGSDGRWRRVINRIVVTAPEAVAVDRTIVAVRAA